MRNVLTRRTVKRIASRQGKTLCFMIYLGTPSRC
jgi:hypothetical protein